MNPAYKKANYWIEWSPNGVSATPSNGGSPILADSLEGLRGRVSGPCLIILSRRSAFVKVARVPNAKPSEIGAMIGLQAAQLFPTASGELAHGFLLTDDVTLEGRLAILAAAPISTLQRIEDEAAAAKISVLGFVPVSLGSESVAASAGASSAAIVEQTREGLAIDLIDNGRLAYSRTAGVGASEAVEVERTFAAAGMEATQTIQAAPGSVAEGVRTRAGVNLILIELPMTVAKRDKAAVSSRARLAALMAVAAIGCGLVVTDMRVEKEKVEQKKRAEFQNSMRTWTSSKNAASSKVASVSAIKADLDRAFNVKQSPSDVFSVLGNEAPDKVWLTGATFERGKPVQVRGTSMTNDAIGEYLGSLTSSPRFRDVKLVFANDALIETSSVVQFSISAHVVGNFPPTPSKKERRR